MKILALDLRKFKSVSGAFDTETQNDGILDLLHRLSLQQIVGEILPTGATRTMKPNPQLQ